jgi:4-hydroxy-tetrahydrodipicolinate reductase
VSRYKVIQWGSGGVGSETLRAVIDSPELELVGLKCHSADKHGRDAGEIAGRDAIGVNATTSADEAMAIDADVVLYTPWVSLMDPTVPNSPAAAWLEELLPILASGKNVVSSIAAGQHYRHLADGTGMVSRLSDACGEGSVSVFFTGVDPGFHSDALAVTMASVVENLQQVRTWEFIDYSDYPGVDQMNELGFGMRPDQLSDSMHAAVLATWGCAPWVIADSLGVELDEIRLDADAFLSTRTLTARGGTHIAEGTVGAIRWSVQGIVAGEPLITVNHVNRMGADMAPNWPSLGEKGGYRVELDGFPPYRGDFPLGQPGGTGTALDDAMRMTSARCVNAIETVISTSPGYKLLADLPPFGARFTTPRRTPLV